MSNLSSEELQKLVSNISTAANSYNGTDTLDGIDSRAAIRGAARQLFLATSNPMDNCWEHVLHMTELVAIRACLKLGAFKAIPLEGSVSAQEIAKATNATPSLIERMLRVLVGTGFLDQTRSDGGDYKHTKFSSTYLDVSVPGPGTFFQAMYDVYLKTTLPFDIWMEKKKKEEYREPSSNFDNPFVSYYGNDGQSAWDVMASIPEVMKVFQVSLLAMDQMMPPTGSFYDFSQFKATDKEPDRIQIVDVGGGYGKVLKDIVAGTPELDAKKCVLQDVGGVIGIADAAREFGLQTGIIDFHAEQPIKGARAYYMRFISHDYSDEDVIKILSHVAKAMAPDSKLLLADCVIPQRLSEGQLTAGVLDQLMFCIGGKERTRIGFTEILDINGLNLVDIHHVPGSTGAIVEAMLKH